MMSASALIILRTAHHRYAARHSDLAELRQVRDAAVLETVGGDRPCVCVELGAFLDPADISTQTRRHALLIPLRRRYVALLVDAVEAFLEYDRSEPLPGLLQQHLTQPWAVGVLNYNDIPIVQLDVRAIARSVLLQHSSTSHDKGSITYASGI